MKKLFTLLTAALCTLSVWAHDFEVDGIYYNILADKTNEVEVTYYGDSYWSNDNKYSGTITIPATVTYDGTTYKVTRIGTNACRECSALQEVTIPHSIKSMGDNAFYDCRNLTKTNFAGTVADWCSITFERYSANPISFSQNLYINGAELVHLEVPGTIDSISSLSFYKNTSLKSVKIAEGVKTIGQRAFANCEEIRYVSLPQSLNHIKEYALHATSITSLFIPKNVNKLDIGFLSKCQILDTLVVDQANRVYDSRQNCNAVVETATNKLISGNRTTIIPNNVTTIGKSAFAGRYWMPIISIPASVTCIEDAAFSDARPDTVFVHATTPPTLSGSKFFGTKAVCKVPLKSLAMYQASDWANHVSLFEEIFDEATLRIYYTSTDGKVITPKNTNQFGATILKNTYENGQGVILFDKPVRTIGESAFQYCSTLKTITIPNSVTHIYAYAFQHCSSLTSITIPESVTSFGDSTYTYNGWYIFSGCTSLESVDLQCKIEVIPAYTFAECSALKSIVIPETVKEIQGFAFMRCTSLASVTLPKSMKRSTYYTFSGCTAIGNLYFNGDVIDWCTIEFVTQTANPLYFAKNFYINQRKLTEITIPNTLDSIRAYTFINYQDLNTVTIPHSVQSIGEKAFAGCSNLYDIYCYASVPPAVCDSSFHNYLAFLYVPCESQRAYKLNEVFSRFRYIECISSEEVRTNGITVTPGTTDVTITWPSDPDAETYSIVIYKNGKVVCTLTFNSEGQLLNIAFAPGREGNHPAQYAEATTNGYRFTVTGLEEGTDYTYTVTSKDAANKTISEHKGAFTTQSTTAVEDIQYPITDIRKEIRNGQLIIIRDGVEYNAMGVEL